MSALVRNTESTASSNELSAVQKPKYAARVKAVAMPKSAAAENARRTEAGSLPRSFSRQRSHQIASAAPPATKK